WCARPKSAITCSILSRRKSLKRKSHDIAAASELLCCAEGCRAGSLNNDANGTKTRRLCGMRQELRTPLAGGLTQHRTFALAVRRRGLRFRRERFDRRDEGEKFPPSVWRGLTF